MALKWKNANFINSPFTINNIDITKIVVSNKFTFGKQDFKYFIGYKVNKEIRPIRPLCKFFSEMNNYKRYSDKNKCMYFIIKYEKMFDKYMIILEKVSNKILNLYVINFI